MTTRREATENRTLNKYLKKRCMPTKQAELKKDNKA